MHDLGKAETPADVLPGHHGHEARGHNLVKAFAGAGAFRGRIRTGADHHRMHPMAHRALELKPATLLKL